MNNRKRTADYSSPPVGALVGTLNNPGVRYFVRKIHDDGSVDVTERPACQPSRWSLWQNKTFTRGEWARLMDRWVLVWIGREVFSPVRTACPFQMLRVDLSTMRVIEVISQVETCPDNPLACADK